MSQPPHSGDEQDDAAPRYAITRMAQYWMNTLGT